jgi:hypothetical protein
VAKLRQEVELLIRELTLHSRPLIKEHRSLL